MDEDKSYLDISNELDEDDALKDELLSVEKKDKKIRHMGMKRSIIIVAVAILLIVALILGYVFFWGKGAQENTNVEILYDYEQTDITRISIQNNVEGDNITFTSFMNGSTQAWNIEGQKFDDVNQSRVRSVAQFASHLESKYILDYDEALLSEYGLKNPSAVVEVSYADGSTQKITVGDQYGNSEGAYVLVEGKEKIYIVSDYARMYFTFKLSELLNLPSLARTAASAQTLSIFDGSRNQTVLSYIPDPIYGTEAWFLIAPADSETSVDAVDTLFSNLGSLALHSYYCEEAGEELAKYGFDNPAYELQSYDMAGKLLDHFIVGKFTEEDSESRYCMLMGDGDQFETSPVYLIKESDLKTVYANPVTLANPYMLALNINWLRSGKIVIGDEVYEIKIDRQIRYDDQGKILYNDDGTENTTNTYYINDKKLDETQFKYFYRTFLFLQIEGVVSKDAEKKDAVWEYELNVVIPVKDNETGENEMREMTYAGTYYLVNDSFAVLDSNQSDNAVFTVRTSSINQVKEALLLLLEGRMPTH